MTTRKERIDEPLGAIRGRHWVVKSFPLSESWRMERKEKVVNGRKSAKAIKRETGEWAQAIDSGGKQTLICVMTTMQGVISGKERKKRKWRLSDGVRPRKNVCHIP